MEAIDLKLAATLRRLRESQGIAQEELGRRAGLSEKYVGLVERGKRGMTVRAAARLARGLGVPLPMLLGDVSADPASIVRAVVRAKEREPEYDTGPILRVVMLLRELPAERLSTLERFLREWMREGPQPAPPRRRRRPSA